MPQGGTGTGIIYFDILQALIEAQQRAAQSDMRLYFDISNCWLYQVEVLTEGYVSWAKAEYSSFRVYYFETGRFSGLMMSYHTSDTEILNEFIEIRKSDNILYSIHKINNIEIKNDFYNIAEEDGNIFKLYNGDTLDIWFDCDKIPYKNYQLFILLAAHID